MTRRLYLAATMLATAAAWQITVWCGGSRQLAAAATALTFGAVAYSGITFTIWRRTRTR